MSDPISKLIDNQVVCARCGVKGFGNCNCWKKCYCGWLHAIDEECSNPKCRSTQAAKAAQYCICDKPGASRKECAIARNIKTPCRCTCHMKDKK